MAQVNILETISLGGIGGGERHLLYLADDLNKKGYGITVVCPQDAGLAKELREIGIDTVVIDMANKYRIDAIFKLYRFIKTKDIGLLHAHGLRAGFFGCIAAKLAGVPVIIITHHVSIGGYPVCNLVKNMYRQVNRFISIFTDKIIAVSSAVRDDLIKCSIPAQKIAVIYNGIDLKRFNTTEAPDLSKLKREFQLQENERVVGIIGRLVYEKRHRVFLEAAKKTREVIGNAKFLIIGDGPLRKELEEMAFNLGIRKYCIFTGFRQDIPRIISLLDVFVLSSIIEGLPISILEAMAMAKPVIATRAGGIPEVIENGKNGILIPPEDPQALSAAIINLLENRDKAEEFAAAGKFTVENRFNLNQMLETTEELFNKLIQQKAAGKEPLPQALKKILLVQLAGIGDLVMATPAISAIRERFPDAYIALLTTGRTKDLLKNSKDLNRIFSLDYEGRFRISSLFNQENLRVIGELRRQKFDLAVNLYQIYSLKGALQLWLFFRLIKIKFIAGRDTAGKGFFLNLKIAETAARTKHEVESNLRLAELLGARPQTKNLHLDIDSADGNFIAKLLASYGVCAKDLLIGINPGSAWRLTRRWLPERFAQTADEIINKYPAKIVLTGSREEAGLSEEIISLMKRQAINTAGKLNIPQLVALIKRCNLYISTDSGPMHIAAAVKTPLIALFGPGHKRYFPYADTDKLTLVKKDMECNPCYKIKCSDLRCMELITVDDVLEAVGIQLKKSGLI